MKKINRSNLHYTKLISSSIFTIFLLMCSNIYMCYSNILSSNKLYNEEIKMLYTTEFKFINSIIKENNEKAYINSTTIKDDIELHLNQAYINNYKELKQDIQTNDINKPFSKIINKSIEGKFINVDNDSNDLFVILRTNEKDKGGKIIADKSLDCSKNLQESRNLKNEIELHYNKHLASFSLDKILKQDTTYPIFWEFKDSKNPNHIKLINNDIKGLENIFEKEGIDGLKAYEFLCPTYIKQRADILGKPIVNNGIQTENDQLIIVQGWNLFDELVKNHKDTIQYFDDLKTLKTKEHYAEGLMLEFQGIFGTIILMILAFLLLSQKQALENIKIGSEKDLNDDKK